MAVAERRTGPFTPIIDAVARGIGRAGTARGTDGKGLLQVGRARDVQRVVKVYWTPFQVQIEGECLTLHLEVKQPRRHWTEGYFHPDQRNWVLCFYERADGDVELAYYRDYGDPVVAADAFFKLSAWYTLTATDTDWSDVTYEVDESIPWGVQQVAMAGTTENVAMQESLKKSTILWMRYNVDGREFTLPVWYLLDNKSGSIYVISGERNQMLPGAERIKECDVIFRQKGKNIQVAEVPASVRVLVPGGEWDEIAEKIAEKRLNIPGKPEDTAKRWRDHVTILELKLRA
jgi:hypothetical protein